MTLSNREWNGWSAVYAIIVIALLSVCTTAACALKGESRQRAAIANVGIYEALGAIQDTADELVQKNAITAEQRREVAKYLLPALETGRALNAAIRDWPQDKPAPEELQNLVTQLNGFVTQMLNNWPDSPGKAALATKLALAQQAVLLVAIYFTR
jgi:hypothetical protein